MLVGGGAPRVIAGLFFGSAEKITLPVCFIRLLRSPTAPWRHISLYLRVSFSSAPRIFYGIVVACEAALLDYFELLLKCLIYLFAVPTKGSWLSLKGNVVFSRH